MSITNATRLAEYVGAGISINAAVGIITAQTFSGNITGTSATFTSATFIDTITGASAVFNGNVSIAGTLTYEDVTNVDSIGIITARNGVVVNSGGVNVTGIVTATSFFDADGSIKGVGIATAGGIVGTGVTLLDFRNSGISTITVSSGIATLEITGGGGGSSGVSAIEYFFS